MAQIRLVMVSDIEGDARLIAETLREAGLDVLVRRVESGAAFAAELAAGRPDIVVSDYQLHAFSARQVLDLLDGQADSVPVVVVASDVDKESAAAVMSAGAADFVPREDLYRLAPVVQRELRNKRSNLRVKEAELALQQSQEHYGLLAQHSPDIIFRCNVQPHFEVTYLSPATAGIVGQVPESLYGPASEVLALVEPDDRALIEASWRTADPRRLVTRWRRPDGTQVWLEQRLVGIRRDEKLISVEGILRDVSDRIIAERERDEIVRRLQRSEWLTLLGKFAGGMAHDFNNVLAVILGTAELIADGLDPGSTSHDDVRRISAAAQQGVALTRHLLIFARRQPSRPQILDLNSVLGELENVVSHTLGDGIDVAYQLSDDIEPVRVDRDGLEQAVVNLVQNAGSAMTEGGQVTIRTMPVRLSATDMQSDPDSALLPGSYTRLIIADTGCGMTPEVAERAFEPMFAAGPGNAIGLGLTVVREVIDKAGGRILMSTKVGEGTSVIVDLPITEMAAEAVESPASTEGRGETVLVVEDNDALRDIVARLLARHKYQVCSAQRGADALELCLRPGSQVDVLLSDMVMPGMDGPELTEKLRANGFDIPVLYMSGYTPDLLPNVHPFDRTLVIDKPFDASSLLRRLREVIDQPREGQTPAPALHSRDGRAEEK